MPYLPPPPAPPLHQVSYEDVRQISSPQPLRQKATDLRLASVSPSDSSKIPPHVYEELQVFMRSLPAIELNPDNLIAQRGILKPGGLPLPKPTDKLPPPPLPPKGDLISVIADKQEYNINTQVFVATGNVIVRYKQSELRADRVQVNVNTQDATADGNVFFTRGDQKLRGSRLDYNYRTVKGVLLKASGSVNLGTLNRGDAGRLPSDQASGSAVVNVLGSNQGTQGDIRRIGFIAERIILENDTWVAENLSVTNDPFTPPELQLVTSRATLTPISPTQDRLEAESPTLLFDGVFSLPVPVNSVVLDRFQRPAPALFGFDRQDRGGLFYQQSFNVIAQPDVSLTLAPQLLIQKAFSSQRGLLVFDAIGLVANLQTNLGDGQSFAATASLSGLDASDLGNQLRANARYQAQVLGDHTLVAQYAFRDRLFNGSLGFQDVNNSLSVNLFSPDRVIGDTGIVLNYQVGAQLISALRGDLEPNTVDTLGRVQSAAVLSRSIPLLRGTALPEERDTGLKYSARPVVPGLDAYVSVSSVYSLYSNGASQGTLTGTIGLSAVIGNFSKEFLDYTGLNFSYSQALVSGQSPFFFDRVADTKVFTLGFLQQIYGPFRFGIQQSWNVGTGQLFDSVYTLQYDRRTYAVIVRYNPNQGIGEFVIRISDFNWTDTPSSGVTPVQGGIERGR
ncbi:Organic solvent tolerance-like N-terminal domain-containing protein [Tumidithrix helvetica PCC 7403]|uniref:DUF3769 domain-containing protein n=1 Tax=Tumidithrix helvetica TaxID=3457545 RepID=UPI003CA0CF08